MKIHELPTMSFQMILTNLVLILNYSVEKEVILIWLTRGSDWKQGSVMSVVVLAEWPSPKSTVSQFPAARLLLLWWALEVCCCFLFSKHFFFFLAYRMLILSSLCHCD